ncbi:MAG: ATPase, partial [Chitinophagaceae bacterium]|nr:ATPase [Chitinophagaceae bacterium]
MAHYQQQEIDLIEETNQKLTAFECKWKVKAKVRFPQKFTGNYPGSKTHVITPSNIEEFI